MDPFPLAQRTNWKQEANALNKLLEEFQAGHVPVLDLTASNPTTCGFKYPQGMLDVLASKDNFGYSPEACGMKQARQAVAGYYKRRHLEINPDNIVLTASTSEAYSFLMRLLVNPAERVLIPRPSYPLFQFLLEINDAAFDYYPLVYDRQRWRIDTQALGRLADAKTRAIILVNPNNPTGSYISRAELNFISEFCFQHQMAIISDEVFFEYNFGSSDIVSCLENQKALTFVLGGLSKTIALPQMKCAWTLVGGPKELVKDSLSRLEIIADTYLSVNTPVQNALGVWLDKAPGIQAEILTRVKSNWQWLQARLTGHTELLSLQGGWYATLRLPAIQSEEAWVMEFLKEDHVAVYPGYFFDFDTGVNIILSLLPPGPVFQEGAGRIIRRLARI